MNPSRLVQPRQDLRARDRDGRRARDAALDLDEEQLAGERVLREDVEAGIEVVLLLGLAAELALDGHHGVDGDALGDGRVDGGRARLRAASRLAR